MPDDLFLPRAEEAEVPEAKLRGYALNAEHSTGCHKARVFLSALAIGQADWTYLRDQILARVAASPVTAVGRDLEHGGDRPSLPCVDCDAKFDDIQLFEHVLRVKILARLGVTAAIEAEKRHDARMQVVGHDISDLRFIADVLKASERRLVVEDFHYLAVQERRAFAFDLKALWDYGVFVVIVGVWSEQNMLLYLNPDLTGRVHEIPIVWTDEDLALIFERGGRAMNLRFSSDLQRQAIVDCFENAGILQKLIVNTLDELDIEEAAPHETPVDDLGALESASMAYAEELNALYQQFARRVSKGIRSRENSTGIYAHAMAAIKTEPDGTLTRGVSIDRIFAIASAREDRIQKGNLHTVLEKIERLQVDDDGRGLVLAYNEANREVSVVDRQLLLYRKYSTVTWPWEELITQTQGDANFQADEAPIQLEFAPGES